MLVREKNISGVNLSISHGISGILAFLASAHSKNIEPKLCKELIEGTIDYPFSLVQENQDLRFCGPEMMSKKKFQQRRKFYPMARILRSLELDDLQREEIKDFIFDFRLCHQEVILNLRESERDIIEPFNEQRRTIFEAYKNGEITRDEAKEQLQLLTQEVRQALQDNGARVIACEAMKECRKALFEKIRTILNEDQIVEWDEWVSNLPEVDCERE